MREAARRLGADGEISNPVLDHLTHLFRIALLEDELDFRIALDEGRDHARQHVFRLRVRRADGKGAAVAGACLIAQRTQRADIVDDAAGDVDHVLARRRDADDAVARPHEDIET
jgi:hypothetical protein